MPTRARASALQDSAKNNEKIDRGVFEEIDAVGEQRHGTDGEGDGELDPEISEVEQADQQDSLAEAALAQIHGRSHRSDTR
jgi:hypothetical protein